MAAQVDNAIIFRPSTAACDEIALLSRTDRSSHFPSPASKAKKKMKKKNTKKQLGRIICLKGLASPVLYLTNKARELRIWYLGNDTVAAASSEHQTGTAFVEPYFSIPVVVPV